MNPNVKPSDRFALLGTIDPDANTAATYTSDYADMSLFGWAVGIVKTGILGTAATVDAKLVQATASDGTGKKDVTGKAITQLVKASNDDDQVILQCKQSDLDMNNNFRYVAIEMTVGAATSDCDATLLGFDPKYAPGSDNDLASVVEIV